MSRRSCASLALVEAAHDGRLGKRDIESLQRHVSTCNECRKLASDLIALRELAQQSSPVLAPLEARRTRVRLLRTAARPASASETRRRPWIAAGFATAAVVALCFHIRRPSNALLVARSGVREHSIAIGNVTTVCPSEGTVFNRQTKDGIEQITLDDGKLDISVRPLQSGERFVVLTRNAEVEVRGTIFGVESDLHGIRRVFVVEGKVEVRYAGAIFFVAAGNEWRPQEHREATVNGDEWTIAAQAESREWKNPIRAKNAAAVSSAPHQHSDAASEESSAQFGDAVGAMEKGNYGTAADRLERFAQEHPEDVRAEDAAFLAILAMKRSGRHNEAADAARRYLARFPKGFRRSEAESIAASSQAP